MSTPSRNPLSEAAARWRRPRGLSLVEVMVALVVGIFLLAGLIQVLTSGQASYRSAEAKARIQENGRYAIQYLSRELRPARSNLCRSIAQEESDGGLNVVACALLAGDSCSGAARIGTAVPLAYSATQRSDSGAWLSGLPGSSASSGARGIISDRWVRGDVLVSWGTVGEAYYTDARATATQASPVTLSGSLTSTQIADAGFRPGRLAMISNCKNSDVFAISNDPATASGEIRHGTSPESTGSGGTGSAAINSSDDFGTIYNIQSASTAGATLGVPRAMVAPFDLRAYFICCVDQQTGNQVDSGAATLCSGPSSRYRPALCQWSASGGGAVQVVVLDVADLRVTHDGRMAPHSLTDLRRLSDWTSLPAPAAIGTRWPNVYSSRVELLVTGGDELRATAASPAAVVTGNSGLGSGIPDDRRLYETFSISITNRARTLWHREQ